MDWASILPLVLLVVAFVFLVIRPARGQRREFQKLQSQLEPGQRVMLSSGIFGEVASLDGETAELQIAPGTVITVNRHAISRVVVDLPAEPDPGLESGRGDAD
ncbi:MAG: yajC [Aeromicrobium sp.]|nr:yajC [Aeromicrobium sp.]